MTNPAGGALSDLLRQIRDLSARVARLEGQRVASVELARVISFSAGSAVCTVRYPDYLAGETPATATLTGRTRVLPFAYGTSPIVGSNVLIVNSPAWSGVIMPISAF